MELDEVVRRLLSEEGVVRVEPMDDELCRRIVAEESTVRATGGMEVDNVGMRECMGCDTVLCVFTSPSFRVPDEGCTLRMVDSAGNLVGHNVTDAMVPDLSSRPDVVFLSDDFVMYSDPVPVGDVRMELHPMAFTGTGGWMPPEADAVLWYASPSSCGIICDHFRQETGDLAAGMLALRLTRAKD